MAIKSTVVRAIIVPQNTSAGYRLKLNDLSTVDASQVNRIFFLNNTDLPSLDNRTTVSDDALKQHTVTLISKDRQVILERCPLEILRPNYITNALPLKHQKRFDFDQIAWDSSYIEIKRDDISGNVFPIQLEF